MNIHPLFVHFPIGLLVVYVLMALIAPYLQHKIKDCHRIKLFLLFTGTLSLYPALLTGSMAAGIVGENNLIETHEVMAIVTTVLFSMLSGAHLLRILTRLGYTKNLSGKSKILAVCLKYLHIAKRVLLMQYVYIFVVILAMSSITITGALGASIVYGPKVDPFVNFIYNLFL